MPKSNLFENTFSIINLTEIANKKILLSNSVGIDGINKAHFEKNINENITLVSRKCLAGTYRFTFYRQKLLSKGKGKPPREISIPTFRDRLVLRALLDILDYKFNQLKQKNNIYTHSLAQVVVSGVSDTYLNDEYSHIIKIDIKDFYPSINHQKLSIKLNKYIKDIRLSDLVMRALKTSTVVKGKRDDGIQENCCGIQQGLSISNTLSNIFMYDIDKKMKQTVDIKYFRYVDDILIFTHKTNIHEIVSLVLKEIKKHRLEAHKIDHNGLGKSRIIDIMDDFEYLGYRFYVSLYNNGTHKKVVSVRKHSVEALVERIIKLFTKYRYHSNKPNSYKKLLWHLNLKISGCIFENKRRGWLFYFSRMTDKGLLVKLDKKVSELFVRFGMPESKDIKKFSKTHYEMVYNLEQSKYLINFDTYNIKEKKTVLFEIFGIDVNETAEIEHIFKKKIGFVVKDLELDIKSDY